MPRKLPPHESVADKLPDWDGGGRILDVTLTYELHAEYPSQMVFKFIVNPINYPEYKDIAGDLIFGIAHDCTIVFKLDPAIKWRWSEQYFVLSAKKNYKKCYGDITIDEANNTFSMKAKWNKAEYPSEKTHKFNLNIDYWQGLDASNEPIWLPITIDPDVPNPKPGGPGFTATPPGSKIILSGSVAAE